MRDARSRLRLCSSCVGSRGSSPTLCSPRLCLFLGVSALFSISSKIEAGQLTLNFSSQNISEVLESAALLCYDMAASKGLSLSWFVDPSLPPTLMIDSARLSQILLNLLSNAIKFTKTGGVQLRLTGRRLPAHEDSRAQSRQSSAASLAQDASPSPQAVPSVCSSTLMRTRTLAMRASSASPHTPSRSLDAAAQSAPTATASSGGGGGGSGGGGFNPPAAVERWTLTCSIRDTGIGISGEQMQLLFQTFSQVQHMSGEYGGTGRTSSKRKHGGEGRHGSTLSFVISLCFFFFFSSSSSFSFFLLQAWAW